MVHQRFGGEPVVSLTTAKLWRSALRPFLDCLSGTIVPHRLEASESFLCNFVVNGPLPNWTPFAPLRELFRIHSSSPSIVPRQRLAPHRQACSRLAFFVCFSPICKL